MCALDLARRFADGGCLWCVAPQWPDHAHHLAVEFVHPVIVGKRALPAVAVTEREAATAIRDRSGPRDAMVVVDDAAATDLVDLARRAQVWGLATVWIGTAASPPAPDATDHVLLCDDPDGLFGRQAVLSYHVLWELTHVCLEHPGLLQANGGDDSEVCVTCSDEGRMGEVVSVETGTALVRSDRGRESVDLSLVPGAAAGDVLLIHAGVAITSQPERADGV